MSTQTLSVSDNNKPSKTIPLHQAKVVKEAIENGNLFSVEKSGMIKPEPIYNQATGYQLEGVALLEAQIQKAEKNYSSNIVGTYKNVNDSKAQILKGERGVPVLYKGQDGLIHNTNYFFPEQTSAPEQVAQSWSERIRTQKIDMSDKVIAVDRADAKSFLAAYFAATKMNAAVKIDEATAEAVKEELREKIDETFRKYNSPIEKGSKIAVFNNLVFEAQKDSSQIVKTFLPKEMEKEHPKEKKRSTEQER